MNAETTRLDRLKETLDDVRARYVLVAHDETVRSAQEGVQQGFGSLGDMAPTFIIRFETGYLAAIIRGDTRLSYKKIKQKLGLKNISLASPEEVRQVADAEVGHVSLINSGIETIIDSRVAEMDTIYGGCGIPSHTLQISPRDLITLTSALVFDFSEPKENR